MRTLVTMTGSACGYTGAVVGVIAVASIAVLNLQAKALRHWDADIDRIVAKQKEKKHLATSAPDKIDPRSVAGDTGLQTAVLTTGSAGSGSTLDTFGAIGPQKPQAHAAKPSPRRTERRTQNFVPSAVIALPKLAINAATNSFLKLR